jgi:hypothetical protein
VVICPVIGSIVGLAQHSYPAAASRYTAHELHALLILAFASTIGLYGALAVWLSLSKNLRAIRTGLLVLFIFQGMSLAAMFVRPTAIGFLLAASQMAATWMALRSLPKPVPREDAAATDVHTKGSPAHASSRPRSTSYIVKKILKIIFRYCVVSFGFILLWVGISLLTDGKSLDFKYGVLLILLGLLYVIPYYLIKLFRLWQTYIGALLLLTLVVVFALHEPIRPGLPAPAALPLVIGSPDAFDHMIWIAFHATPAFVFYGIGILLDILLLRVNLGEKRQSVVALGISSLFLATFIALTSGPKVTVLPATHIQPSPQPTAPLDTTATVPVQPPDTSSYTTEPAPSPAPTYTITVIGSPDGQPALSDPNNLQPAL